MAHRDAVALAESVFLTELQEPGIDSGTVGASHVFYIVHVAITIDFGMTTRDSQPALIFVGQVNIREEINVRIGAAEDNLPLSWQSNAAFGRFQRQGKQVGLWFLSPLRNLLYNWWWFHTCPVYLTNPGADNLNLLGVGSRRFY